MVRQRNLARPRPGTTANQCDSTGGVMRCPEAAGFPTADIQATLADGCYGGCFQRLTFSEWRQDSRQARSQHGFTRAWRAAKKDVVPACCGDFECPASEWLPDHIDQVLCLRPFALCLFDRGRQRSPTVQPVNHRQQAGGAIQIFAPCQRSLGTVFQGHNKPPACQFRLKRNREDTFYQV